MSGDEQHASLPRPASRARDAAKKVAEKLARAGFIAYFAGGCVRDAWLGDEPKDYDIATDARPEQVEKLFRHVRGVGQSFGVMLVRLMGTTVEVATFRTDGVYSDSRHPDEVTYSDAEHDARRRDFTINGLFEDPLTNEVIDHVGGRADLEAGVIRAIGDPAARLNEDQLRMLRAVRFAARFDFRMDGATTEAIAAGAGQLEGVSRERIGQEVRRMMLHPRRAIAARLMQELGLDKAVLTEPAHRGELPRLEEVSAEGTLGVVLAAWGLDRNEGAEIDPDDVVQRWTRALMLANDEADEMKGALRTRVRLMSEWPELGVAEQKRLASSTWYEPGLELVRVSDREAFERIEARVSCLAMTQLAPRPLLDGEDLIREGFSPGPAFKGLLDATYDAQLEGKIDSREAAMALARRLAGDGADLPG